MTQDRQLVLLEINVVIKIFQFGVAVVPLTGNNADCHQVDRTGAKERRGDAHQDTMEHEIPPGGWVRVPSGQTSSFEGSAIGL